MLFFPLNAVLVAAYVYLGGLGAAAAPMNFGNELSSAFTHFGRSISNTPNEGARAYGEGLQHSQTQDPTQMIDYKNFVMLLPDTQGAPHQGPGGWNVDYVGSSLAPFAAQNHPDYHNVHAYHNAYGTPGYSQHSDLSIESAPSLHQQQGEFGNPGIPSLGTNQHDHFGTAFYGYDLDTKDAGNWHFPASLPTGGSEATPLYPPHPYGYSHGSPMLDRFPVGHTSHVEIHGQNPAYQGMSHPTAAVADGIDDADLVEEGAETARKAVARSQKSPEPQDPISHSTLQRMALESVRKTLQGHFEKRKLGSAEALLQQSRWAPEKDEKIEPQELDTLVRRLENEWEKSSKKGDDNSKDRGHDDANYLILFSRDTKHEGPTINFRAWHSASSITDPA
ncbi:hypothetical protein ACQY0O_005644 [Thecaphora frezii]